MDHSISLNQDSLSKSYSKGSSFFGFKKLEPKIETSNLTPTSTTTTAFTNSSTEKTCNESFPLNSPISFELIVDDLIDYWSLFPSNIQHSILQYTSPNLHQLLSVSKSFKLSIQNYVIKRTKLFKELKDEASTWGHKAPQLFEILASDPLIIQSIVNVVFDPNFSNDRSKEKDVEKMLPILHKHIFKSFEAAINNYSQYYTAIPHLVSIILRVARR